MPSLADYGNKYSFANLERTDGVLELRLHTEGGPLTWNRRVHRELPQLFADVAADLQNRVIIMTGTGDSFCANIEPFNLPADLPEPRPGFGQEGIPADLWNITYSEGKRLLANLLEIDVPIIAAINGPALIHAELAVISDIVLAAEDTSFSDIHIKNSIVPGDGAHIIWPMLLGPNRGRYFLMMAETLTAEQALDLGVVGEVVEASRLMDRAWEIANRFLALPPLVAKYSRVATTYRIKRAIYDEIGYGLALQGLAQTAGRPPWDSATPILGELS
jgi:enoyl-CoA hydratase/carnithine racemase